MIAVPKTKILLLAFTLILLLPLNSLPSATASSKEEAEKSVNAAHNTIIKCYEAAAEAQKAGANVTSLLNELNKAGQEYSKAVLAYNNKNYSLAAELAYKSESILENFVEKANQLKVEAIEHNHRDFMINFVGSGVGSVLIIVVSLGIWTLLKRKYATEGRKTKVEDYRALFLVITFVTALLVASPALSRLLVYPRTEFFTELWILDSNHRAENYPFNISNSQNYNIYLGVGNHLGYCAYYTIQVKFRNQTQPAPTSFGPIEERSPSGLPSLFNITAFVADEQVLEIPLTFSFNYAWNETSSKVKFSSLTLNNVRLNISDYTISWDPDARAFRGFLFFELWLYNSTESNFQYHGRFVGLWLNMTVPV